MVARFITIAILAVACGPIDDKAPPMDGTSSSGSTDGESSTDATTVVESSTSSPTSSATDTGTTAMESTDAGGTGSGSGSSSTGTTDEPTTGDTCDWKPCDDDADCGAPEVLWCSGGGQCVDENGSVYCV